MEGWDYGRVYGSQFSRQDVDRLNHLPSHPPVSAALTRLGLIYIPCRNAELPTGVFRFAQEDSIIIIMALREEKV